MRFDHGPSRPLRLGVSTLQTSTTIGYWPMTCYALEHLVDQRENIIALLQPQVAVIIAWSCDIDFDFCLAPPVTRVLKLQSPHLGCTLVTGGLHTIVLFTFGHPWWYSIAELYRLTGPTSCVGLQEEEQQTAKQTSHVLYMGVSYSREHAHWMLNSTQSINRSSM